MSLELGRGTVQVDGGCRPAIQVFWRDAKDLIVFLKETTGWITPWGLGIEEVEGRGTEPCNPHVIML